MKKLNITISDKTYKMLEQYTGAMEASQPIRKYFDSYDDVLDNSIECCIQHTYEALSHMIDEYLEKKGEAKVEKKLTLKEIRTVQDLSQEEFAEKYGITKQTVHNLENGHAKLIKADLLLKICSDFGIDPKNVEL